LVLKIWSTLTALVILAASAVPGHAQGLADVAKKEQQRRKAAPPAQKIYTEDDLAAGRPAAASPVAISDDAKPTGGAAAQSPSAVAGEPRGPTPQSQGESYWRGRFGAAREAIATAEARLQHWERLGTRARSNGGTVDFRDCSAARAAAKPGDRIRLSTCAPTDRSLMGELDAAREAVAAARKALIDLESEARRNGALPAWMR
jgi:hypothetical protein